MYDTLIIIGNGFDVWQGLKTSYSQFRKYYLAHRDEILKKLKLKKYKIVDPDGETRYLSDVEIVYGDPFEPAELTEDFWNTFESSLDDVDGERLNAFYGKTNKQLYQMQTSVENAQKILRMAFSEWIKTIQAEKRESGYIFGNNCFCINFNYTDTVKNCFGAPKEYHIHGQQSDEEEIIIFGHADHPQRPVEALAQFGGRFLGLYILECMLYETDKGVYDNIQLMRIELASEGVCLDKIRDIYVLGHSFGPADFEYFQYIFDETSVKGTQKRRRKETEPVDSLDELHLRIQYAIHKYGEHSPVSDEEKAAVARRLSYERACDEREILRDFYPYLPELKRIGKCESDARWHISYYSEKDKNRIQQVMKEIGCTNYELFDNIDECIRRFKV